MTDTSSARRIVVGVDGSPCSKLALEWAGSVATALKASIDVVAAWEFPPNVGWAVVPDDHNAREAMEKAANHVVEEVFGDERPPGLRVVVQGGPPAQLLIDKSEHAFMIVVGSRGHGGFMGLLLGSVSARVAEHAKCPVLVVHGDVVRQPAAQVAAATATPIEVATS
jgi:nucleotide-binding universal stress UspA family protein